MNVSAFRDFPIVSRTKLRSFSGEVNILYIDGFSLFKQITFFATMVLARGYMANGGGQGDADKSRRWLWLPARKSS